MDKNYVLHTRDGVQLVTEAQTINNALEQEKVELLRVMLSGIIRQGKTSHRPAGLYGQLLRTVAALCTADLTENDYNKRIPRGFCCNLRRYSSALFRVFGASVPVRFRERGLHGNRFPCAN